MRPMHPLPLACALLLAGAAPAQTRQPTHRVINSAAPVSAGTFGEFTQGKR